MRRNLAPLFFVLSCTIEPGGQVGPVDLGEPAEQTVTIRGPAAYAAAPNGITLSLLCKSGASISLQGDFEESPRTLGCDRGAATARLVFTGDDGTKLVQVRQRSVEVSRAFLKSSAAPVDQWAPIADTVNLCGTNQIAAHPLDRSNVLIINDFPLRMQYSRDGGTTRAVPTGDPFAQNIVRAWADPYVAGTFYATLFVGPTAEVHDILKTTDGGQSWIKTGRAPLLPGNIPISHDDYANIYDAGRLEIDLKHRLYAGYRQGIAYSDDEGQSWVIKTYPQLTSLLMTHITPSPDAATIWVGTDNLGVFKSSDGGATIAPEPQLSRLNPPYTASTPHRLQAGVLASPYNPGHLIAAAGWEDGKVMRSTDGGLTWIWIGGAMSEAGAKGLSFLNGTSIAFEPGDTSTFWIQSYVRDIYGNGVILTSDGGETFAKVPGTQHRYSTVVGRAVNGMGEEVLFQADNCAQASSMKIDRF